MKLYYGLTNYHMLSCILHKLIYNSKEKSIFVASQGILRSRIRALKKSNIFDEVYYLEDTNIRDSNFNSLNINATTEEIEKVTNNFINSYESILPFNINKSDEIYLAADHGVFGIYILMKKNEYIYLEDGRGIYSNWRTLDDLLRIKNPGIQIMASHYDAYGKSNLIKKKYIAFDSQLDNCDFNDCINFDVNELLDKLTEEQLKKVLDIFELRKYNIDYEKNNALVLTQRFTTYGMLEPESCILMYSLLCDFFAKDCKIFLKPHPADKCEYYKVFDKHIILEKEMPSELIRFVIKKNFDIGISTYSSSIYSLKKYINTIYNIDEKVIDFKNNIFKLYALFEIASDVGGNIKVKDELLDQCFQKCYNLNTKSQYLFNFSNEKKQNINIVKDNYFQGANCIVKINSVLENENLPCDLLNKSENLYMKIKDMSLLMKLEKYRIDKVLPISKIHISIRIENLN